MYINKVMLFGNLTRDPEVRALPSGSNVCSFSIATNRVFRKQDGSKQEEVQYHNIVVFGRQADTCAQYLKKGSSVYIEGRLQTRSWDSDKGKQYRTEVVADVVQFGPRATGGAGSARSEDFNSDASVGAPTKASGDDAIDYPQEDINPDDIPF
jgi:single-strand DNA-binding protein